jgi:hypothetical protein
MAALSVPDITHGVGLRVMPAITKARSGVGKRDSQARQLPLISEANFMKRVILTAFAITIVSATASLVPAADTDPSAVLDKAIKALGGEKLNKVNAISWKSKVAITFNDNTNEFTSHATLQDLDHYRSEMDGEFGGNPFKGVTVFNGEKGWRKFGDNKMDLEGDALANQKRQIYLQVIPALPTLLKGKGFKLAAAAEEKVDGKPADGIKVTAPDGKDFTLYFDKETGLPVKLVAKMVGFQGDEFTMETFFKEYKDFDGIKKATKTEGKRDGQDFVKSEVTDFKVLDKVDSKIFSEPE